MGKRENRVETHLNDEIEKLGGVTKKWKSPMNAGVQDRIVILPGGIIIFAEVKADDCGESTGQVRNRKTLTALGCDCRVLYGMYGVNHFIDECRRRVGRG
jgi:hypothetical protein